ncbi:MAG: NAD(P)/FAD-dependent oxidoreductase [Nitrospirales bacterium]|nr:NAD(P)/FAD-dependent oxidoreductase [Nitrospirales bacterium]
MDADVTVIGAGVVGLAVAATLADGKSGIYILEKNESHGRGTSSRNSEVIHAGLYYPPGSLKARLCVEGREMLYEICKKHALPHRKTGKLLIAASEREREKIEQLYRNALQNGVESVSLLEEREVRALEPNIKAFAALYSPETGILSAHSLMDYFLHTAKERGAEIVYHTLVIGVEGMAGGYRITTVNAQGEYFAFTSERVVNAAGLQSDVVARMVGKHYLLHYCKGDYFSIDGAKRGMVGRLVYPVPEENHVGLGVHLTLDLAGRMRLGPDAAYTERVEDYRVAGEKADMFYASAARFLPFLRREDIIPDMSGIRPKLQARGEGFRDFLISEDMPGFVNLVGIESPGLTAAPAIARFVKNILTC